MTRLVNLTFCYGCPIANGDQRAQMRSPRSHFLPEAEARAPTASREPVAKNAAATASLGTAQSGCLTGADTARLIAVADQLRRITVRAYKQAPAVPELAQAMRTATLLTADLCDLQRALNLNTTEPVALAD